MERSAQKLMPGECKFGRRSHASFSVQLDGEIKLVGFFVEGEACKFLKFYFIFKLIN